jgi:hypothetical protein
MYKESTDELEGRDCHQTLLITASVIPPTKRDIVAVERNQTVIGDGDTVRIASEVAKNLLGTTEGRLRINNPVLTEQRSQESREALRLRHALDGAGKSQPALSVNALQAINELPTEYFAENPYRKKERISRVNPL